MTAPRKCFWIPSDHSSYVEGHGFIPAVITEGQPGYQLLAGNGTGSAPYYWGQTYDTARKVAEMANADNGITPDDARDIRLSSMRASRETR